MLYEVITPVQAVSRRLRQTDVFCNLPVAEPVQFGYRQAAQQLPGQIHTLLQRSGTGLVHQFPLETLTEIQKLPVDISYNFV